MEHYLSYLKKYRQLAGLTQEDLAERVNVRRETIVRLEAAKYNPSLKLAVDISRTVNAPLEDIFVFPAETKDIPQEQATLDGARSFAASTAFNNTV
jgi:DNA-binding XRE family transcriptional regulator